MPRGPSSLAKARVMPTTAAFDTVYTLMLAPPRMAAIEARLTMLLPRVMWRAGGSHVLRSTGL